MQRLEGDAHFDHVEAEEGNGPMLVVAPQAHSWVLCMGSCAACALRTLVSIVSKQVESMSPWNGGDDAHFFRIKEVLHFYAHHSTIRT